MTDTERLDWLDRYGSGARLRGDPRYALISWDPGRLRAAILARRRAPTTDDTLLLDWLIRHGAAVRRCDNSRRNLVCWAPDDGDAARVWISLAIEAAKAQGGGGADPT